MTKDSNWVLSLSMRAKVIGALLEQHPVPPSRNYDAPSWIGVENLEPRLLFHGTIDTGTDPDPHNDATLLHANDPTKQVDHLAFLDLVKHENATHIAVNDGFWSNPLTWESSVVPGPESHVLISSDTTVIFDAVVTESLHTIRVDGVLQFDHTQETQVVVDTFVVATEGSLIVGTEDDPIANDVTARIVISDTGPIDTDWDPTLLSRGLINHGMLEFNGSFATPYLSLADTARRGNTELLLSDTPINWRVGDRLVLTGTHPIRNKDEELKILGISGNRVTVDALRYHHAGPTGHRGYVANVSRNVVVLSENPHDNDRRGHAMFMHSPKVHVRNAGFYGLGRSDKRNVVNDPVLDDDGHLIEGTGLNPRGRYSVHFHRNGDDIQNTPAVVMGSVVVDSPGWGFVNHDSHVIMEQNISFDVAGAGFVTEVGNEVGTFRHNLAIRSEGSGNTLKSREDLHDFGHGGHGFWFQGAGIEVEHNIASGHRDAAFIYFTRSEVAKFDAENLLDPSWANGREKVPVGNVPIRKFYGNEAFASRTGFESWFHLLKAKHDGRSVVEDFTVWRMRGRGMRIPYTNQMTLRNVKAIGNMDQPSNTGIGRNHVTRNIVYENLDLEGWEKGVNLPKRGHNVVVDGYFNNIKNIVIPKSKSDLRTIDINGKPLFGTLNKKARRDEIQIDYEMQASLNLKDRDISKLYSPDIVQLGTVRFNGKQLYFHEQAADFVPFKVEEAPTYIPNALVGKSNQQIWDEFGIALAGAIAPADAMIHDRINGLIGDPTSYMPELKLKSRKYTNRLNNYVLVYQDPAGKRVRDPQRVNLQEGWNVITRTIDGATRSFFVYGDNTNPTFVLSRSQPLVINPVLLSQGFSVHGKVTDDSVGTKHFKKKFNGRLLQNLPVQTRPDGSQYLSLRFRLRDRAGNRTPVNVELTLDSNASLNPLGRKKNLARRRLSSTLLALHSEYVLTQARLV